MPNCQRKPSTRRLRKRHLRLRRRARPSSIDDSWQSASCNAVEAQIRDAGINIKRRILPGSTFWNDWTKYPFSAADWNMRPRSVQILALSYPSSEAWNETAIKNPQFDALLAEAMAISNVEKRREVMAKLEAIMQEEGVLIQPYWRSNCRHHVEKVKGADMHPTFDRQVMDIWLDARHWACLRGLHVVSRFPPDNRLTAHGTRWRVSARQPVSGPDRRSRTPVAATIGQGAALWHELSPGQPGIGPNACTPLSTSIACHCIMFEPDGGNVDPSGVTNAYDVGARQHGAEIHRFIRVTDIEVPPDSHWIGPADTGDIRAP